MMETKIILRKKMRSILKNLNENKNLKKQKESIIHKKLFENPKWIKAKSLLIYLAKPEEVSTKEILKMAFAREMHVFTTRVKGDELEICEITKKTQFKKSGFCVFEPKGPTVNKNHFDIMIIPGLAFDLKNRRLGRGKGYYDRFLKNFSSAKNGYKIGLAFTEQSLAEIPNEMHDVRVDLVINDSF